MNDMALHKNGMLFSSVQYLKDTKSGQKDLKI